VTLCAVANGIMNVILSPRIFFVCALCHDVTLLTCLECFFLWFDLYIYGWKEMLFITVFHHVSMHEPGSV
jgi:hypothetical protein